MSFGVAAASSAYRLKTNLIVKPCTVYNHHQDTILESLTPPETTSQLRGDTLANHVRITLRESPASRQHLLDWLGD